MEAFMGIHGPSWRHSWRHAWACIHTNPREFTRIRPLRPSKYKAPERRQNATPREFTRIRPLRPPKYKLQSASRMQPPVDSRESGPKQTAWRRIMHCFSTKRLYEVAQTSTAPRSLGRLCGGGLCAVSAPRPTQNHANAHVCSTSRRIF